MAPNFNLKDKVVAITGGSGGIGFATAQLLLAEGAKVSIADISSEALEEAKKELLAANPDGQLLAEVVDVRKREQVDAWVTETVQKWGKLDGACNLAG